MKKLILKAIQLLISFVGFLSPSFAAKTAAYFFARPKRRKNRAWMKSFLDTSVNDYFEFEKRKFKSYVWPGKNKGILFLHGWRSNAARWKYLITQLEELDVDLIAFDAPGHGESGHPEFTPPNYAAMVDLLVKKYKPRIIVAHSVGAYTALLHQHFYETPDIKYVLLAPTFDIMLPINKMFEILNLSPKIRKAYIDFVERGIGRKMITVRADHLITPNKPSGILLHDVNDKILPYIDSLKLMEISKSLKFHKIDSNGHRMQNDDVEEIILGFIKKELAG